MTAAAASTRKYRAPAGELWKPRVPSDRMWSMRDVELLEVREGCIAEVQRDGHALDPERGPTPTEQIESGLFDYLARGLRVWWQQEYRRAGDRWFAEARVYVPSPSGVAAVLLVKDPWITFSSEADARACAVEMVRDY